MTRWKLVIAVLLGCLLSAAGGFWFGFREGLPLGLMADSLPRGAIAMQQLAALRSGKTQNLATALEFNVDDGLVWGYDVFNHPLRPLFGPVWAFNVYPEYEKYAVRLADYRREHPSPMKNEFLENLPRDSEQDRANYAALSEGARLHEMKLNAMVQRYASRPR
jgi:hypothetical protein